MKLIVKAAVAAGALWAFAISANAEELLTKATAIERALVSAPSLKAAEAEIRAISGSLEQAGLRPNPSINLTAEDFTGTGPFTGLGRSEVTLTYNQRFERGGKRRYRAALASSERNIASVEWQIRRLDLIREVDQAYLAVQEAQARVKALDAQLRVYGQINDAIAERVARGRDSDLAAQNASIRLIQIRNEKANAAQLLEAAKLSLARLWQSGDISFDVDDTSFEQLPVALPVVNVDQLLDTPNLLYWEKQQESRSGALALEKAKRIQDPTVGAGLRYLNETGDVAIVANVSVPFSLYDTNRGNIRRAKAEIDQARFQYLEASRRAETALLYQQKMAAAAYTQIRSTKGSLEMARKANALALEQLSRGLVTYLDVFTSQSLIADLQAQNIDALSRFHSARIEINRLTAKADGEAAALHSAESGSHGEREGY